MPLRQTMTALAALLILTLSGSAATEEARPDPTSAETAQILARERTRSVVVAALELYQEVVPTGIEANDNFVNAVGQVADLGDAAVPFLTIELAQQSPASYRFCAYALGLLPTAESKQALLTEIERNDADGSDIAMLRKAWAAWALALQGRVEALDLFDAGRHRSTPVGMHLDTTAFEAAAILTAPASASRLVAQLATLNGVAAESQEASRDRLWRLRALRRVADPDTAPAILLLLADPDRTVRFETARALGTIGTDAGAEALQRALEDEQAPVRRIAAMSLADLSSPSSLPRILERLEIEDDAVTRGALYLAAAKISGATALPLLKRNAHRPDPIERRARVDALLAIGPPAIPALAEALTDPAGAVSLRAAAHLGTLEASAPLLAALPTLRSPAFETAMEQLVRLNERKAGPILTERLARQGLIDTVTDPTRRNLIERICQALADLAYVPAAPVIREALPRQTDAALIEGLSLTLRKLDRVDSLGKQTAGWIAASTDPEPAIRTLAWNHLAEIGTAAAVEGLAEQFAIAESSDQLEILRAIGKRRLGGGSAIVVRVLTDPAFDAALLTELRDAAAWAAWRIGGPEMIRTLRQAVERRSGRDAKVAVYYALAARRDSLPTLAAVRSPRFRYLLWTRGREQELLDSLVRELRGGREPWSFAVPPQEISLL